jgi:serine/threonine protein kinase
MRIPADAALAMEQLKPEETGDLIGPYKLLEQIGEGGFGCVWIAEQTHPVRRTVALKIIKVGMNTKEVVARFQQERQALAAMDHPNIAKVWDAGATLYGRPFFAMELVRGLKITQYCDQARLTVRERLALFVAVCRAVQHAHQKGIIHRDLKPSNVLVTVNDDVAVPKIIDFGVAKATQQRFTDLTIHTQIQQMVGTPLYMSPEQAEMSALDVDTRTDIYSLGVLLYELLTGRTSFDPDLMRQSVDEMRRIIRECEPLKPSAALLQMRPDSRAAAAAARKTEEMKLLSMIRGDLDCIVMKTLEKLPARRYSTANELAIDIERHLANQPVLARPPSTLYRMRRFARRHKAAFVSGVSIAAALVIGTGVSAWQAVRAARESARAKAGLEELRRTAPALAALVRELIAREDYTSAIATIGYAIQLQPQSVEYLHQRAALFQGQQRLREAAADFRQIVALDPSDAAARAGLEICERIDAAPRASDGNLPRDGLATLYGTMKAGGRPAAELKPLMLRLDAANTFSREQWLDLLKALPNRSGISLDQRLKTGPDGNLAFDLSGTMVADLSPLRGMPLESLDLSGCSDLRSLEPLRGMPLRRLAISRTAVSDLSPLSGMALTSLELGHTLVTSLAPIAGMPLKLLECSYTPVSDYSPIATLRSLEQMALQGVQINDLEFVRALPLKVLVLARAQGVRDLAPLSEIKTLETLVLPRNPFEVADSPDRARFGVERRLERAEIDSIEALRTHPSLKQLSCTLPAGGSADSAEATTLFWRNWDRTMQWWRPAREAELQMKTTRLEGNNWFVSVQSQPQLTDLTLFAESNITMLDLSGCSNLSDLSPLRDLPLKLLAIGHTAVRDLMPLSKMPLQSLWMADTKVTDLRPIRTTPLKVLYLDKNPQLTDISPLVDNAEITDLVLSENAADVTLLRGKLKALQHISYTYDPNTRHPACAPDAFWKEYHDLAWLRALRAARTEIDAQQLPDGTWRVAVRDAAFADATIFEGARISMLYLHDTRVADLRPLERLPLRALRLDGTPCADVTALCRIATLESLVLPANAEGVHALRKVVALKRLAFSANANGEPSLDAAAFWTALDAQGSPSRSQGPASAGAPRTSRPSRTPESAARQ